MKRTAVLIDDEAHCTDVLAVMLEKYCPEVEVTGSFNDPEAACKALPELRPHLVFLDIEMPRLNGFDLLHQLGAVDFRVIFTTAYDQYAVRAIRFNALDYLLKPIDRQELVAAVQRAWQGTAPAPARVEAARLLRSQAIPERIALPVGQELIFVDVADILYCESDGSYVQVHLRAPARPLLITKSLRELEELLQNPAFFRTHNSWLVHLQHVHKILRAEGGGLVMRDGTAIPVARAKKAELLSVIARL